MSVRSWYDDESGAIGPAYAVAILVLVAIAGVGFDYGRMAGLDTELQDAADHAALAGATQLDGKSGACARAFDAAKNHIRNNTRIANDGGGAAVTFVSTTASTADCSSVVAANGSFIRFWQDRDKTTPAIPDDDSTARFIEVSVDTRTVRYALTPLIGLFNSGAQHAGALAGLGSSICNTPPVMMCNPSEPSGNGDRDYPFSPNEGDGVKLVVNSPQAPGDFGFLQTGYGTGAQALAKAIGYNSVPADCSPSTGVDTEPGDKEAVRAAFNTRFDLSESGLTCPGDGTCSPSRNVRKDLVHGNNCGTSGNQGWQEAPNPYRPTSPSTPLPSDGSLDPQIMGYPRDMCHAVSLTGSCAGGIIGDGLWDRDAYFRVNYHWNHSTWMTNTGLSADATRYDVYKWELENPGLSDMTQTISGASPAKHGNSSPECRSPSVMPDATTADRRRISVAVINCQAENVNGREYGVRVLKWMDVFLVEPAFARGSGTTARTTNGDIYVEVISETPLGGDGNIAAQTIRRDVPFLVR